MKFLFVATVRSHIGQFHMPLIRALKARKHTVAMTGDGVNDVFEIKNIDKYPQSTITIYNGLGKKLIEYKANESRGWDGNYNGIRMPSDDYWYEINIKETDETIVGHFTLIRD